ncbi:hypothetical protein [Bradyrhizobium sp. 33ap4]|uniref:hypothetical protein n=1 Tax=Bradyrhizobium sp. 33ap4 TaxID=3061630 RepID=UPI00293066FD|nr:hypothetical protein [Bradyrhizobium sp. 33ap4]
MGIVLGKGGGDEGGDDAPYMNRSIALASDINSGAIPTETTDDVSALNALSRPGGHGSGDTGQVAIPLLEWKQIGTADVADELEYSAHRLVDIEQPGGGFLVEITPLGGGQTVRTMTYQSTLEAISAAKRCIDKHPERRR